MSAPFYFHDIGIRRSQVNVTAPDALDDSVSRGVDAVELPNGQRVVTYRFTADSQQAAYLHLRQPEGYQAQDLLLAWGDVAFYWQFVN